MVGKFRTYKRISLFLLLGLAFVLFTQRSARADGGLDRNGTLWRPYLEWEVANGSYTGNPFDLVASVTFTHEDSGESRTTEMFYAGSDNWRFRFTGTRTGIWAFSSSSSDPELNGLSGMVTISANAGANGFLSSEGNKFARQQTNAQLKGFLHNIYANGVDYGTVDDGSLRDWQGKEANKMETYCSEAQRNGFSSVHIAVYNQWFQIGADGYDEHSSVEPELESFEILEKMIVAAHTNGCVVHIWAWGDEARKWTPVGVPGGINGVADRRVQRYIAARLAPLPGWTMGYGFDLEEWVTDAEICEWANYLHQQMGWDHLLWARNRSNCPLDAISNDRRPTSTFYGDADSVLNSAPNRPHIYERRFLYTRDNWDMETTRRALWQFTMAGGATAIWGIYWDNGSPHYPNPEQLRTHAQFWQQRFLLDLEPANQLTNGWAVQNAPGTHHIFYKENADTIQLNLSRMNGSQPAIAVDTKKWYREIDLGRLAPANQSWEAPYKSDWAIAVGEYEASTPYFVPSEFQYLPSINRGH